MRGREEVVFELLAELVFGRLDSFARTPFVEDAVDPAVGFGLEERDLLDGVGKNVGGRHAESVVRSEGSLGGTVASL